MGKYLLQIFILSTLLVQTMADLFCVDPDIPTMVDVVNNLPPNSAPLNVHCWSGDNDMGNHALGVDQDYYFPFCTTIGTLYSCSFSWNGKYTSFDVLSSNWKTNYGNYYWIVKSNGIFLSDKYLPQKYIQNHAW